MTPSEGLRLQMTRVLPAPIEDVWRALTDPRELPEWFGPKGFGSPSVDFEPRVGRTFRIAMQPPEGDAFHLDGQFREVEPPSRLSYTFVWDPPHVDDRETVVTLSLEDRGDQTDVGLRQGEFATAERLELHRDGWTDSFDRLEELLG
jgi:uncharacterized protein YndB with AHSA1/START domain